MGNLRLKIAALIQWLFFAWPGYADATAEFNEGVYPKLRERCAGCHESRQRPYHASDDIEAAYLEAKSVVNVIDPDASALWIRSYNGHCGVLTICGSQDEALLAGIRRWAAMESQPADPGFDVKLEMASKIPQKIGDTEWFESILSSNLKIKARIRRMGSLTGDYFVLDRLSAQSSTYASIAGFMLQSGDLRIRHQNFRSLKSIIKPSNLWSLLTPEGSNSILFSLVDQSSLAFSGKIFLKSIQENLTLEEFRQKFEAGYYLPFEQYVRRPIKKLFTSANGACVLDDIDRVLCWGAQSRILGTGEHVARGADDRLMGVQIPTVSLVDEKIETISMSESHACALTVTGKVKCWGENRFGSLGLPEAFGHAVGDDRAEMGSNLAYVDLGAESVIDLVVGGLKSCAIFESGRVKCWGSNDHGNLGLGDIVNRGQTPLQMGDGLPFVDLGTREPVKKIYANTTNQCVIFESGRVKCWGGENTYGQLGTGDLRPRGRLASDMGQRLPFVNFGTVRKVIELAMGESHLCALFEDKKIKCLGYNGFGQLGLGDQRDRGALPSQLGNSLPFVDLGRFVPGHIYSGSKSSNTCAVDAGGAIRCWGENGAGSIGNPIITGPIGAFPNQMGENLSNAYLGKKKIVSASLTDDRTCVLDADGYVSCWGYNARTEGLLGIGITAYGRGGDPREMGDALPTVKLSYSPF